MKTLVITVPARVELTPELMVEVFGTKIMSEAKRALQEKDRKSLGKLARQSSVTAYSDAVQHVVAAITRFEASKGTRDERRALAHLEASCVGLRKADRALKSRVDIMAADPTETEEN